MTGIARRGFLGGVAAAGLGACTTTPVAVAVGGKRATLAPSTEMLARFAEQILVEYPENATTLGVDNGARAALRHRLTDRSAAGRDKLADAARARLAILRTLDLRDLARPAALDAAVTRTAHEITDQGYRFPYGDVINLDQNLGYRNTPYVVNQLSGAFVETPDFLDSRHMVNTSEDAEAYADRVDDYVRTIDGETERLAHDRGIGVVAPDFLLDKTIRMIAAGATVSPDKAGLVTSLASSTAKAKLGDAMVDRVQRSVTDGVIPALRRQAEELRLHRAVANGNPGVWDLPDGEAYYRWALGAATTTTRTPQELHQLGRDQSRVILARMDATLSKRGLTSGSVGERYASLSKDPAQLFPNTAAGREQLLAYLNGRVADIRTRLPRAFATLVPGTLVIKRVPLDLQATSPGGYASAGSLDGSVPGQYYINLRDTAEWPKFSLPTLTYHEGIPGHI